jgi:membrane protease YdiL (CAAX protease family)
MYQGLSGFVRTALTGALLGALYLTSESIIYVIILHFVIDISANYLLEEKMTEQPMAD